MKKHPVLVRILLIITMILLTILEVGPVPVTALIGLYVAIFRPRWFINLMDTLYDR
jgi:hypothetical protein